jgi:O-antigen ligase
VHLGFLGVIGWLLYQADSATSFLCLLIGGFMIWALGLRIVKRNISSIGTYIAVAAIVFLALYFSIGFSGTLVGSLGRDTTFTGRASLWEDVINLSGNPIIGVGYESFWLGQRIAALWEKYPFKPMTSHNGYLEIYLNLGIIGLVLLAGVLLFAYRRIQRELIANFECGQFGIAVFIILLIYNFTEASFKSLTPLWFVFLLCTIWVPGSQGLHPMRLSNGGERARSLQANRKTQELATPPDRHAQFAQINKQVKAFQRVSNGSFQSMQRRKS